MRASRVRPHLFGNYPEPELRDMVRYFEIARGLANGFKHFKSPLPGKQHAGTRGVTSTEVGFGSPFSDEFCRPLNAEYISVDILLRKLSDVLD
jgi:hypothetical protein